jgi:L,D-transpeptidase catalytic domain
MIGNRPGRRPRAADGPGRGRAAVWLTVIAAPAIAVIAAVTWLIVPLVPRASAPARTAAQVSRPGNGDPAAVIWTAGRSAELRSAARPGGGIALDPGVRAACPPAASACADLADHITWLQSAGRIAYGPVRMEPGAPGDPTPRGTFHVAWKAGAHYISTSFGVPIPYAVFFAAGGIAFHAGSLTLSSHGCIHLTLANARYYHDHLPVGAEVDVF